MCKLVSNNFWILPLQISACVIRPCVFVTAAAAAAAAEAAAAAAAAGSSSSSSRQQQQQQQRQQQAAAGCSSSSSSSSSNAIFMICIPYLFVPLRGPMGPWGPCGALNMSFSLYVFFIYIYIYQHVADSYFTTTCICQDVCIVQGKIKK
jgi:hypothetical protein